MDASIVFILGAILTVAIFFYGTLKFSQSL
jgi:hypothetical protein